MANKIKHTKEQLIALLRKETKGRMKLKLLALLHFHEGKSRYQIADYLKVSRASVNAWISAYLSSGLEGLQERKHTGRPPSLSKSQFQQVSNYIERSLIEPNNLIKAKQVQDYISTSFGVKYEISNIYKIIRKLSHSSKSPV